jgi:hypothetical protein
MPFQQECAYARPGRLFVRDALSQSARALDQELCPLGVATLHHTVCPTESIYLARQVLALRTTLLLPRTVALTRHVQGFQKRAIIALTTSASAVALAVVRAAPRQPPRAPQTKCSAGPPTSSP